MPSLTQRFRSLSFEKRLIVLATVFDPLGALAGYALHEPLGVEPLMGAVYGLVVASLIVSSYVGMYIASQGESERSSG